jgi:cytochrome c-type biogenesis protein CcmH
VAAGWRWRRATLWAAVAVVAGLALAVGAGAFSSGTSKPVSLYQRTLEVAGQYRCPVCASESAAVSDASEAVQIRSLIEGWLKKGDTQAQIRSFLVSDYGASILEKPPATGLNTLVWALPAVAGALGVAGLGFAFVRWRRASAVGTVGRATAGAGPAGHGLGPAGQGLGAAGQGLGAAGQGLGAAGQGLGAAGAPPSSSASAAGDEAFQERLFDVGEEGQVVALAENQGPSPARPLYRRVAPLLGAVLIVVAGALWLVDRSSSQRLPGATATGGATGVDEELQQAATLASSDPAAALAVYDEVLVNDPNQPVALSGEGWIYAEAGYVAKGEGLLQKAETDDPSYDPPHLYRGLVLLEDQRKPAAAIKELKWYLAHGPDPSMTKTARTALAQAEDSL